MKSKISTELGLGREEEEAQCRVKVFYRSLAILVENKLSRRSGFCCGTMHICIVFYPML
jgi:hypothetical protein